MIRWWLALAAWPGWLAQAVPHAPADLSALCARANCAKPDAEDCEACVQACKPRAPCSRVDLPTCAGYFPCHVLDDAPSPLAKTPEQKVSEAAKTALNIAKDDAKLLKAQQQNVVAGIVNGGGTMPKLPAGISLPPGVTLGPDGKPNIPPGVKIPSGALPPGVAIPSGGMADQWKALTAPPAPAPGAAPSHAGHGAAYDKAMDLINGAPEALAPHMPEGVPHLTVGGSFPGVGTFKPGDPLPPLPPGISLPPGVLDGGHQGPRDAAQHSAEEAHRKQVAAYAPPSVEPPPLPTEPPMMPPEKMYRNTMLDASVMGKMSHYLKKLSDRVYEVERDNNQQKLYFKTQKAADTVKAAEDLTAQTVLLKQEQKLWDDKAAEALANSTAERDAYRATVEKRKFATGLQEFAIKKLERWKKHHVEKYLREAEKNTSNYLVDQAIKMKTFQDRLETNATRFIDKLQISMQNNVAKLATKHRARHLRVEKAVHGRWAKLVVGLAKSPIPDLLAPEPRTSQKSNASNATANLTVAEEDDGDDDLDDDDEEENDREMRRDEETISSPRS